MLDMTALAALSNVLNDYEKNDIGIIFLGASARVRQQMRRARIGLEYSKLSYAGNSAMAKDRALHWLSGESAAKQDDDTATPSSPSETQRTTS